MLTNLRFQNFKSWRDTGDIRFSRLTGFFGPNSSGKTSILQFLLMLKQTVESNDLQNVLHTGNERTYVDLGTSNNWIHKGEIPNTLNFDISWLASHHQVDFTWRTIVKDVPEKAIPTSDLWFNESEPEFYSGSLSLNVSIRIVNEELIVSKISYGFYDPDLYNDAIEISLKTSDDLSARTSDYQVYVRNKDLEEWLKYLVYPGFEPGNSTVVQKFYRFLSEDTRYARYKLVRTANSFVSSFEKAIESIFYVGPLREYPKRLYLWSGERPQDVGKRGELAISALLRGQRDRVDIDLKVAEWLKRLGLVNSFEVKAIAEHRREYEVLVRRVANSTPVTIKDVGFGVSQILPVLVLCYYVPKGSIVILEQPEIHLHPSVQAGLADVLIEVSKERNLQIILESHSEHLLRRLQRRIAEAETITNEDAALYFCEMLDNGESKLNPLELDLFGNIANWPENFFGDEMGDLLAMTEAAMQRQMGAGKAE